MWNSNSQHHHHLTPPQHHQPNTQQQNISASAPGSSAIENFFVKDDFQTNFPMPSNKDSLAKEIRFSMSYLQANKLNQSAKWLGELLVTVSDKVPATVGSSDSSRPILSDSLAPETDFANPNNFTKVFYEEPCAALDTLNLARSLFDLREFRKCAYLLEQLIYVQQGSGGGQVNKDLIRSSSLHQSCLFLKNYALYLLSEQQKEEEILESGGTSDKVNCSSIVNKKLAEIEAEMDELYRSNSLNAINCYLIGIIFKEGNRKSEAREAFVKSLQQMPCLWTAWLELGSLVDQSERKTLESLRDHWMKNFQYANFYLDIQQERDSISLSAALLRYFPDSVYLRNQVAHGSYQSQEYDVSIDWFKQLVKVDPYRYENLDLYSNILYIKENFGELANLAYNMLQNDKYRPEACCTVGNYYSLRGDHHKAVIYFQRAIKLDKKYLSAWTLMGHEYLEMKNTNAAIESYRTAVDIDSKDFRAWYGLGQAYELNQLYNYASHYYAQAALSKPQDSRMWAAMGNCYERMEKQEEAKKCMQRAERVKDKEAIALHKLAKLYAQMNELDKARICFQENLARRDKEEVQTSETVEALLFLAKYFNQKGDDQQALEYAKRLEEFNGIEREEANRLIREINNRSHFSQASANNLVGHQFGGRQGQQQ